MSNYLYTNIDNNKWLAHRTIHKRLHNLEPQLLEEVVAAGSLLLAGDGLLVEVLVLKDLLQSLLNIDLSFGASEVSLINGLLEVHVDDVSGGEDVTDIDVLNKGLHGSGSLLNHILGHATGDLAGSSGDAGNEAVGEVLVIITILDGLDDDSLLTGVTSSKDDNNLSALCENKDEMNDTRDVSTRSTLENTRQFRPRYDLRTTELTRQQSRDGCAHHEASKSASHRLSHGAGRNRDRL